MASKIQIEQRREQVWRLHLEGKSAEMIGSMLGVSRRTVVGDIQAGREQAKEELQDLDAPGYLAVMIERFNHQRLGAWAGYEEACENSDLPSAHRFLKLALAVETKEFQALQKLGFFEVLQRQEAMRENPVVAELGEVDLVRLDALTVMILARHLKVTPEEAVERFGIGARGGLSDSLLNTMDGDSENAKSAVCW